MFVLQIDIEFYIDIVIITWERVKVKNNIALY